MRVGILGSGGFVGQAILRVCARSPHLDEVRAFSRNEFDVTVPESWYDKLAGLDCVVNAAVRIDGSTYEIFKTNCLTSLQLGRHLNDMGIEKLVNLSTGAVYGPSNDATNPGTPCNPAGDYAVSKYLGEQIFTEAFEGSLCHLRIYYPYGAHQKRPRLIPRMIDSVVQGQTITCDRRGGPFLSMSHVDDIASVIYEHFILGASLSAVQNIASPWRISIAQIATEIGRLTGIKPELLMEDEQRLDVVSDPYENWAWRPFTLTDCVVTESALLAGQN